MKMLYKNILWVSLFFLVTACTSNAQPHSGGESLAEQDTAEYKLSMLIVGDLMQHQGQIDAARDTDGIYRYEETFRYVRDEIISVDLAIANFEVTLGGKPYQGYPRFSAPDEYLQASIDAGFDVLLTANNHCLDTRKKGLERTIDMMDSVHIPHLGTYKNREEREKNYPFLIEKNGFRIVLLNFTYGTNGIEVEEPNVVNYMDTAEIASDILKAKAMHPDILIAIPHWGIEYVLLPNQQQKQMAFWLLEKGVDHVIGGHPHVLQPMELRNKEKNGGNVVVYSLGNYVSNMSKTNTDGGAMLHLDFVKRGDTVTLENCSYSLVWVSRPVISGHKNFRIYPIQVADSMLNTSERAKRDLFKNNMKELLDKYNKDVPELKPVPQVIGWKEKSIYDLYQEVHSVSLQLPYMQISSWDGVTFLGE
ncbi:MAG: CapA family protein [Bacteroidales bacterium]|nr:CapA family protein [Bacteroidales bacterium]